MAKNKDRLDEELKSAYRTIKKGLAQKNKEKCLDEETLAAYVEKILNKAEEEAVDDKKQQELIHLFDQVAQQVMLGGEQ